MHLKYHVKTDREYNREEMVKLVKEVHVEHPSQMRKLQKVLGFIKKLSVQ